MSTTTSAVPDRIRHARKSAGFSSQAKLAVAAHVSVRTVERAESTGKVSVGSLVAIAGATKRSAGYLLGEDEAEEAATRMLSDLLAAVHERRVVREAEVPA